MDVWRYHVFARKLSWYFIGVSIISSKEKLKGNVSNYLNKKDLLICFIFTILKSAGMSPLSASHL